MQKKLPIIETPRLILRTPKSGDAELLNAAINRSLTQLQRWQPWALDPSLAATQKFISDGVKHWQQSSQHQFPIIVIDKASNMIIGASGYNEKSNPAIPYYEIGYWLETAYTGQGLATELANALTRFAFLEFNAVRVQIIVQSTNNQSMNVAKRCGYKHEATLQKVRLDVLNNNPVDDFVFARFDLDGLPDIDVKW